LAKILLFIIVPTLVVFRIFYRYMQGRVDQLTEQKNNMIHQKELAFNFLGKAGTVLLSQEDLEKQLEIMGNFIVEALNADSGAIFLRHQENYVKAVSIFGAGIFPPLIQTIDKVFTQKKYIKEKLLRDIVPIEEARVIGHVLSSGQLLNISDANKDPRIPQAALEFVEIRNIMLSPLRMSERILGVCAIVNKRDGGQFDHVDETLFQTLVNYAALIIDLMYMSKEIQEKQRMEQEMSTANEVQKLLLPKGHPVVDGYDFHAFNAPARELGGDYYDFVPLDDGKIGIAIADVSGKGVAAALVMATLRSILRQKAPLFQDDLCGLARVLNELTYKDTKENMFITLTYGVLDPVKNVFKAVRAGHEQILVFSPRKDEPNRYIPRGTALGIVDPNFFIIQEVEIPLDSQDTILLYTDGVTEAMDSRSNEYGLERLESTVQKTCRTSAETIFAEITHDLKSFTRDVPQNDDITMVIIKKL